jgi:hypothetical protein
MADFPTREEIELRAYDLYLERGCEDGHAVEDWLEAERLLVEAYGASTKTSEEAPRKQRSAAAGGDRA